MYCNMLIRTNSVVITLEGFLFISVFLCINVYINFSFNSFKYNGFEAFLKFVK